MGSFRSHIQLVFLCNFLPTFPQHVLIKTTALWQRHASLFHPAPGLSPTPDLPCAPLLLCPISVILSRLSLTPCGDLAPTDYCSTQCLPSLEGNFRGQNHCSFCATAPVAKPSQQPTARDLCQTGAGRGWSGGPLSLESHL